MNGKLTNRQPPAPSENGPRIPLVKCNAKQKYFVRFICLSDFVYGLNLHWCGKSVVCFAPEEPCEHCEEGTAIAWQGFLCATDQLQQKEFIVPLSPGVMPDVNRFLELWGSLRGKTITLTRPDGRDNGHLRIDFGGPASFTPPEKCRPKFDLPQVLRKIFKLPLHANLSDDPKPADTDSINSAIIHRNRIDGQQGPSLPSAAVDEVTRQLGLPKSNGMH